MKKISQSIVQMITLMLLSITPELLFAVETQEGPAAIDKSPVGLVNILQIMTYLILVVVIIIGSAWLFRRYGRVNSTANGNLKVIAGLSVGQRERIVLVAAGDVRLLLGVAPGQVQTLHVMEGESVSDIANNKENEIRKKMLS